MRLLAVVPLFFICAPLTGQSTLRVVSSTPANNAIDASAGAVWEVVFDRPVRPASLTGNVAAFGRWSGVVPGQVGLDATQTRMTFAPDRPYFPGENVTVSLTRNVTAVDGTTLAGGFAAWFWVAPVSGTRGFRLQRIIPMRNTGARLITYGVHAGDIDGDGSPDITASNELTSDLRMLLNDGCGNAGPMTVYPGHGEPSPSESADFNNDGLLDLVTGDLIGNAVSVFLNNGNGGLMPPITLPTGGRTHGVTVLDADGDGLTDIATTNNSVVLYFRNLGGGTFAPPRSFQAGVGEDGIMAADANGDGLADLFVGNDSGNSVAILIGNGTGSFALTANRLCGGRPFQIAVGDVDGDGDADCITANRGTSTLGLVLGDGAGGLVATRTFTSGSVPVAADLGDLDGDGDLDAVLSCFGNARHYVYWNDGTGSFPASVTLPTRQNASCATLVDFDRDGLLDIISADEGADELRIYLQNPPFQDGVQPRDCFATLRVDNWAIAGFRGQPLRPVQAGNNTFFGFTGPANAPFALMAGAPRLQGLQFPFGLANIEPSTAQVLVIGFFGDPRGRTNADGEATISVPVPASFFGVLYTQTIVLDPRPTGNVLLFSNPVGISFVP